MSKNAHFCIFKYNIKTKDQEAQPQDGSYLTRLLQYVQCRTTWKTLQYNISNYQSELVIYLIEMLTLNSSSK